jgi:hypothetical protein
MSRRKSPPATKKPIDTVVRNRVAANPLLGKSCAHGKSRKAERRSAKVSLKTMPFERATSYLVGDEAVGSNGMALGSRPVGRPVDLARCA